MSETFSAGLLHIVSSIVATTLPCLYVCNGVLVTVLDDMNINDLLIVRQICCSSVPTALFKY